MSRVETLQVGWGKASIPTLGDSGDFQTSRYQGIVKATVSYRLEDLNFKISEGSDQN